MEKTVVGLRKIFGIFVPQRSFAEFSFASGRGAEEKNPLRRTEKYYCPPIRCRLPRESVTVQHVGIVRYACFGFTHMRGTTSLSTCICLKEPCQKSSSQKLSFSYCFSSSADFFDWSFLGFGFTFAYGISPDGILSSSSGSSESGLRR